MRVLGLETSCDETAAAVVEDGRRALSDVIASQIDVHRRWGGVVPEIASRNHLMQVLPVIDEALARANVTLGQIDGVAVTAGPGLAGALLVGVQAAKGLAWSSGKPLVAVHHLAGHLHAIRLAAEPPDFPFLGLVVSGGHTSLYAVELEAGAPRYRMLGCTLDDAAGEAFDKVAKLLGLPYPGGIQIDRLSKDGDRARHRFPRALAQEGNLDFSFSGLKTAVRVHLEKTGRPEGPALSDLCASFQEAVADVLTQKTLAAARREAIPRIVVCGGVAANSRLRALLSERATAAGMSVFLPAPKLCTDNGAMIAVAGTFLLEQRRWAGLDLNADPALRLC
ncbi:MAG: tRNA (adenosine(37)-N6)-threonylcarbamoyltransferase complex transferase subunit TsaD [Deltaproteobacteria bacterium]